MFDYTETIDEILEFGRCELSTILPSDWTEQNRTMDSSVSRYQGRFSYNITPYTREIVDCLSPENDARVIAVKKGAQIGFSTGVIEPGVGYIISQQPGNILFLTGHSDLAEEAVVKIDHMIDTTGIRHLIRPSSKRAKSMKTGDTNSKKEFPGGSLVSGSAGNHKLLRQRSVKYGFIDDFDAAKKATKESGSTTKMIEQRFASYADSMKLFYISTPELKNTSNIQPVYEKGDQRKYHIPCPCEGCNQFIHLEWSTHVEGKESERAGISWKLDENGKLIDDSVGYVCQKCGGFFDDSNKYDLNLNGKWIATAKPSRDGYRSYHINSLYAPPGMYDWKHYVREYLEACPPEESVNEELMQTFTNLCLGEPYEQSAESPKASQLNKNVRQYEIGCFPEKLSERDGNGRIVLLTCAIDMNGKLEDARLDYEVVAWSESGTSYSIDHGSIGTFVFQERLIKEKEDRVRWTYDPYQSNSVWHELEKVLGKVYLNDYEVGDKRRRKLRIHCSGLDTGHFTTHAYNYLDNITNWVVFGLKGKNVEKNQKVDSDIKMFKKAQERKNLYLVEVNKVKDVLADDMKLKYKEGVDERQPAGFMNYPVSADKKKYHYDSFYKHYEAEHRKVDTKDGKAVAARWEKKPGNPPNHFWDCRVYNIAVKEIVTYLICREENGLQSYQWSDYVDLIS